jgi:hypothetical protein
MRKLTITVVTILVVAWIRLGLQPTPDHDIINILGMTTICFVGLVGAYFGWKLLLVMVRQLGAAIRGQ